MSLFSFYLYSPLFCVVADDDDVVGFNFKYADGMNNDDATAADAALE